MTSLSKLVVQDVTLMAIITNTKSTFASSSFGMKQNNPIKKKKKEIQLHKSRIVWVHYVLRIFIHYNFIFMHTHEHIFQLTKL